MYNIISNVPKFTFFPLYVHIIPITLISDFKSSFGKPGGHLYCLGRFQFGILICSVIPII
jgi:hypothetical protein